MNSSAHKAKQRLGLVGKGSLAKLPFMSATNPLIFQDFKGNREPIWAWIRIGDKVAYK